MHFLSVLALLLIAALIVRMLVVAIVALAGD